MILRSDRWLRLLAIAVMSSFAATAVAEEAPRAKDGEPGYWRFAGTLSPDGHYVLGWAPEGLTKEQLATLKEWNKEVKYNSDNGGVMNFLMDAQRGKVLTKIPNFTYWAEQDVAENRRKLFIAWSQDCRAALAIYQGRWDDVDVVWIDAPAARVTSVEVQMKDAFYGILRAREKQKEAVATQFDGAAILPGGLLVVSAYGFIPKEGPEYPYRLTFRVGTKGGKVRMELLKARKIPESEERPSWNPESALNVAYEKLESRLDDKGRAALEAEESGWLKWRESLPEAAREGVTAQRAALLKARAEQ